MNQVFIGYDNRMPVAFGVAAKSLQKTASKPVQVKPLLLPLYEALGLYTRPTDRKEGALFDEISGFPMATEFAISRFLVPYLCDYKGWAVFCDSDFLFRQDISEVFDMADDKYAVMCVKHDYNPLEEKKMDGQIQTKYHRKNWSSFILFNCGHEKNKFLSLENINSLPGRDLHGFCWLGAEDIGTIHPRWNWLEGHSNTNIDPAAVHFTRGTPDMKGYENCQYSDEWWNYAKDLEICKLVS